MEPEIRILGQERQCPLCTGWFLPKVGNQIWCSRVCRDGSYYRRRVGRYVRGHIPGGNEFGLTA